MPLSTGPKEIALDPASIETRRPHPLSRMPEGLLDTSDREEVLDLLAYLLSAGDPEHALYR